jgi:thiamine kinase-like enzyme
MIIKKITGGETNNIYLFTNNNIKYIIRKYKYNKDSNLDIILSLSLLNITPRILSFSQTGRIEEYFHGRTLTFNDLLNPCILDKIIDNVVLIHNIKTNQQNIFSITNFIKKTNDLFINNLINSFDNILKKYEDELILCHNDLHINNIMINNQNEIKLIDLEFSGINHWAYELVNFICVTKEQFNKVNNEIDTNNFIIELENYIIDLFSLKRNISKFLIKKRMEEFKIYSYLFWYIWAIQVNNEDYQKYYLNNIFTIYL